MIPGQFFVPKGDILCNAGKESIQISVVNLGDRPVQVGSHFHFFEVNSFLSFDRTQALEKHLDIPSGTGVRFEPGERKEVNLVDYKAAPSSFPEREGQIQAQF